MFIKKKCIFFTLVFCYTAGFFSLNAGYNTYRHHFEDYLAGLQKVGFRIDLVDNNKGGFRYRIERDANVKTGRTPVIQIIPQEAENNVNVFGGFLDGFNDVPDLFLPGASTTEYLCGMDNPENYRDYPPDDIHFYWKIAMSVIRCYLERKIRNNEVNPADPNNNANANNDMIRTFKKVEKV